MVGDLLVEDGSIKDYGPSLQHADIETVDCDGHVLMPGIVDIHVHLRDPGMTSAEDIISGSRAAAAGGVTTAVCQPNTIPAIDTPFVVNYIKNASKQAYIDIKMYGATTVNRQSSALTDMPALYKAGVCGFSDDGAPTTNALLLRKALAYSRELNVPIAQHAEDLTLSDRGSINEGRTAFVLGERGVTNISEAAMVARDLVLAASEKGFYHVMHVSARETLKLIERAKNDGIFATCEVTPHHFSLSDAALVHHGCSAKMNPPLRTDEDIAAILQGMQSGVIDCIASDHAPHPKSTKEVSLSCAAFGIVGLETMLPLSLELYHNKLLSLSRVVAFLTSNPAGVIKLRDRGRIARNLRADLTLVDIDAEYKFTSHSKSHNSPFTDRTMRGRVLRTVYGGAIVYENEGSLLKKQSAAGIL